MAKSYIGGSLKEAGYAAAEAERKKTAKYQHILDRVLFSPLAFETFGPWGPEAKTMITKIGNKIKEHTGEKRSLEYLRQRFSMDLQRGNAASIFGTYPYSQGLDEIYSI